MSHARYLVLSALLTWVMLLTASLLRSRGWSLAGLRVAFGNRDDLDEPTPLAARADRAAKNMLENLLLFVAVSVAVAVRGTAAPATVALGGALFFYARLAYFFVYLAGIAYLRTAIWAIALGGVGVVGAAAF